MSSNVGLSTPRGSGTSGYVQRNLSHLRPRDAAAPYPPRDHDFGGAAPLRPRQANKAILEHDRLRAIEAKVFELQDRLEDEGVSEDEIETQTAKLRRELLDADKDSEHSSGGADRKKLKPHQVHELAEAKVKESERLRRALGISADYEEGSHWRRQEEARREQVTSRAREEDDEGRAGERD